MAMARVSIENDTLVIQPLGINKFWGFHGTFTIPLSNVIGASIGSTKLWENKGFRAPGMGWFDRWVGTFRKPDETSFFIAKIGQTLDINVRNEKNDRFVLTVDDPIATAKAINEAIGGVQSPGSPGGNRFA